MERTDSESSQPFSNTVQQVKVQGRPQKKWKEQYLI